jgi:hypothetical protein
MAAVDDLDETIRQIRTVIFGLDRSPVAARTDSLRRRVLGVCTEAGRALGFEPVIRFAGLIDTEVPSGDGDDVIAVVREGLSNVARAARRGGTLEVADRLGGGTTLRGPSPSPADLAHGPPVPPKWVISSAASEG